LQKRLDQDANAKEGVLPQSSVITRVD
jgi:hypothetical protein